jgi:hypothetical protein
MKTEEWKWFSLISPIILWALINVYITIELSTYQKRKEKIHILEEM